LAQAENQMQHADGKELRFLETLTTNVSQLKELINSLLILSRIDNHKAIKNETCRIDEVIYSCIEQVSSQNKDLKVNFSIDDSVENLEGLLEVNCNQSLLEIAFNNLIKNAYLYADNQSVNIEIRSIEKKLVVNFINTGKALSAEEVQTLFEPFKRGRNAKNTSGLGLGLRIVQRILNTFHFNVNYRYQFGKHIFIAYF
jgi:K+-sensing histidine kinase KdpD